MGVVLRHHVEVLLLSKREVATEELEILPTHLTTHPELLSFQNQLPRDAFGKGLPEDLPIPIGLRRDQPIQQPKALLDDQFIHILHHQR